MESIAKEAENKLHYPVIPVYCEVFQIGQSDDSVREILATRGVTFLPEDALKISTVTFKFRLRTIHYSPTAGDQKPECYKIAVAIKFDNSRHTGQVHVTLATVVSYVNVCNGRIIKGEFKMNSYEYLRISILLRSIFYPNYQSPAR